MIEFVGSGKHIQVDSENGIVKISEIFEWFEEDFIEFEKSQDNHAPTLIDYINRFRSDDRKIDRNYEIEYLSYDKNINSQTR